MFANGKYFEKIVYFGANGLNYNSLTPNSRLSFRKQEHFKIETH